MAFFYSDIFCHFYREKDFLKFLSVHPKLGIPLAVAFEKVGKGFSEPSGHKGSGGLACAKYKFISKDHIQRENLH